MSFGKTVIGILAVALALAIVITPFILGTTVEKRFDAMCQAGVNMSPAVNGEWSFKKGYLQSTAESTFSWILPIGGESVSTAMTGKTTYTFKNYPVLKKQQGSGIGVGETIAFTRLMIPFLTEDVITVTNYGIINLDGSIDGEGIVPGIDMRLSDIGEDGFHIKTSPITGYNKMSPDMKQNIYELGVPELSLVNETGKALIKNIQTRGNYTVLSKFMSTGSFHTTLDSIQFDNTLIEDESVSIDAMAVDVVTFIEGNDMSMNFGLNVNGADVQGQGYGPITFKFALDNLSTNALSKYAQWTMDMQKEYLGNMGNLTYADTQALEEQTLREISDILEEALKSKPAVRIPELSLHLPEGKVNATFSLGWISNDPLNLEGLQAMGPLGALSLLSKVEGKLTLDLDEEIMTQYITPMSAASPMPPQMMFTQNGDVYSAVIELKEGQLLLNGSPFPIGGGGGGGGMMMQP